MKSIVITQPMYFPWIGLFEQIRLADTLVYYDDVQYSKGSFTNRVQIKMQNGVKWMTLPLNNLRNEQNIAEVTIDTNKDWRSLHLSQLRQAYSKAPFKREMLDIVDHVLHSTTENLSEISIASIEAIRKFFVFERPVEVINSSDLRINGSSWQRVMNIVTQLHGTIYITGHGAQHYLDHEAFTADGIEVRYLNYKKKHYPQLHGDFTPYVSILDLIANCGFDGREMICSETIKWNDFLL